MNVCVLGAGVSCEVGYPLTRELIRKLEGLADQRANQNWSGFKYADWPKHKKWLQEEADPQIRHAYAISDLEGLLTLLDLARFQFDRSLDLGIQKELRSVLAPSNPDESQSLADFRALHNDLQQKTEKPREIRKFLVTLLAHYFDDRHARDFRDSNKDRFDILMKFARRLKTDRSVIITLNYDATVERALMDCGLWTPTDGYGISAGVVQDSKSLPAKSKARVLKLHGSIGWYANRDSTRHDHPLRLSRVFLKDLGLWSNVPTSGHAVDHEDERAIILPTYLKNFDDPTHRDIMTGVWHQASVSLTRAKRIWIVGYSLPAADTAVRTLLLCSIGRGRPGQRVKVINPDGATVNTICDFLGASPSRPLKFRSWVQKGCP